MRKTPLVVYVTAVVCILILVNGIVWVINQPESTSIMTFSAGFLLGMLAMFIAVHIYRWK